MCTGDDMKQREIVGLLRIVIEFFPRTCDCEVSARGANRAQIYLELCPVTWHPGWIVVKERRHLGQTVLNTGVSPSLTVECGRGLEGTPNVREQKILKDCLWQLSTRITSGTHPGLISLVGVRVSTSKCEEEEGLGVLRWIGKTGPEIAFRVSEHINCYIGGQCCCDQVQPSELVASPDVIQRILDALDVSVKAEQAGHRVLDELVKAISKLIFRLLC
ncbi:hypothetical protein K469DRAFT_767659 [Zopfia rhizophila CBS 207.26]|uniref:Uncharacterized protein n=1 Tax=Zopfia rhizophila CBS 207.26 TaxID=1314779 RepID=A0A6A6E9F1_9PEZI|nr:hypothetical protein K469DRAFT_767659 [Zopfia rhizophila CBS 207.26]